MQNPGLTVFVGELLGVPKVALSGALGHSQEQAVLGILNGLREQGTSSMVLDLAGLNSSYSESTTAVLNVLRSIGPSMCIHLVASDSMCGILKRANTGPGIKVYTSIDEVSDGFAPKVEYMTSRWMASGSEDSELPMAA